MIWLLLAWSVPALAWDSIGATWKAEDQPVPYWIASDLGDQVDDAEAVAAIQAAFATWEAVECADLAFDYQGRVDDATYPSVDGRNVVFLLDEGWPAEPALVSDPSIVTAGNDLVEVDFALNGQHHAWVTEGADGTTVFDVQAAAAHEAGHVVGLWHSTVQGATLNPAMAGHPDARSLEDDDIDGLCTLYGASAGPGGLGDDCAENDDCAEEMLCVVDAGERYCAPACPDGTCPGGYECLQAEGEAVCAREAVAACACRSAPGPAGWVLAPLVLLVARRRA